MTLSLVILLFALGLQMLRWLGGWVASRRTYRARQWREEEVLRCVRADEQPHRPLKPAGLLHWAGWRGPRAGPAAGPSVNELLAPHEPALLWGPYGRTDPARARRVRRQALAVYIGIFAGIAVLTIGLALTPLRTAATLGGALAAVAAIVWIQRVQAGLAPEHARERLEAVRQDRRAPAILLRPFGFEGQDFPARRPLGLVEERPLPVEEAIALAVGDAAPILAVGSPDDRLPRGRAIRLYASAEHWQPLVRDLIVRARWLILRAGETPGVRWEIEEIIRQGRLQRCVIVMIDWEGYPFGRERYTLFAASLAEWTGIVLPPAGWNSWLLGFDARGQPRLSGSRRPWRSEHEFVPMLRAQLGAGGDSHAPSVVV
jgi:hypothetical protein